MWLGIQSPMSLIPIVLHVGGSFCFVHFLPDAYLFSTCSGGGLISNLCGCDPCGRSSYATKQWVRNIRESYIFDLSVAGNRFSIIAAHYVGRGIAHFLEYYSLPNTKHSISVYLLS